MNRRCRRFLRVIGSPLAALGWAAGAAAACQSGPGEALEAAPQASPAPSSSLPSAASADAGPPPLFETDPLLRHCGPRPLPVTPNTIAAVVREINRQPKPLTLGCFLRSFERPLGVQASNSIISAQPAMGARSPRMFIFNGQLVMTIVPAGPGSALLELGEFVTETRTLKAELHFPVTEMLEPSAPFVDLDMPDGTSCRGCHAEERPSPEFAGAYISDALKPEPHELVLLSELAAEAVGCDVYAEAERCALLRGVFAYGAVVDDEFPEAVQSLH